MYLEREVIVGSMWSHVTHRANVGYSHHWTFRMLLVEVTTIPMDTFLPAAFFFFWIISLGQIQNPFSSPFCICQIQKKKVAVNPAAAEAQDQVVAAPLLWAACSGWPRAAHSSWGPCARDDIIKEDEFSAVETGEERGAGLFVSWDCYLILRGEENGTNAEDRLA